ncbi:U6 snRNA phosphodiesterase Usb1 [Cantharellus anzutake]|uniref:U6 snRNA phosphodiesterase Usb1 n=1 Tax=Cantharellus anzutake TaxID=1750568 RepID=UPI0019066EA8|nr:U6 snRNA phosphodiesterase Usb1 [Cantharellus anzutake]KAF8322761.1 U6 snRNA phosphodiesterase Usb1 [Cantharellus anzutake]
MLSPRLFLAPLPDPAAHQGRIRAQPHVEGQWAAHVYVPIPLSGCPLNLRKLLHRLSKEALTGVPELYPFLEFDGMRLSSEKQEELHISLSRPIFLRAHQREGLKKAVKRVAHSSKRFQASFSRLTVFRNDEGTRTFLSIEVGAGYDQFRGLADGLTNILAYIRQKEYYTTPRFHASIAWALLSDRLHAPDIQRGSPLEEASATARPFPSVSCIPNSFIDRLEREFGDELRRVGRLDIDRVSVKIGKEVFTWGPAVSTYWGTPCSVFSLNSEECATIEAAPVALSHVF